MFAHDFPAQALLPASAASIRSFLKVLALANANARGQCRLNGYAPEEATTFTIDQPSVEAMVASIASGSGIGSEEALTLLDFLLEDTQSNSTRPIVITGSISSRLICLVREAEAVFRGLPSERAGNLISYSLFRSEERSKQLGSQLGSRFAATVFHCADVQISWREDSPFEIHQFDMSAVSESEAADIECLMSAALECGRLVSAVNDEFSSHLLAQPIGHAIARFCISK